MPPELARVQQTGLQLDPTFRGFAGEAIGTKILGKKLRTLRLPAQYSLIVVQATKLEPDEGHERRAKFTRIDKRAFYEAFAQRMDVTVESLQGWHLHHVVPVCIGGSNRFNNLDLIPPDVHNRLHQQVIDPQTFTTYVGMTQDFLIPVRINKFKIKGLPTRVGRQRPLWQSPMGDELTPAVL